MTSDRLKEIASMKSGSIGLSEVLEMAHDLISLRMATATMMRASTVLHRGDGTILAHQIYVADMQKFLKFIEGYIKPSALTQAECDCPALHGGECTYPDCTKAKPC